MQNQKNITYGIVLFCFFLSGCAALIYETLWVRVMTLFLGNTHWAQATVVAAFMAGLAIGSYWGGKYADRFSKYLLISYGLLELGIAFSAGCSKYIISFIQQITLTMGVLTLPLGIQYSIWLVLGFCILLIPTALMGATLPILSRWSISSSDEIGSKIGILYGANTLGAVAGVLVTGFFLIEHFGMTNSFWIAACINILCAGFMSILLFVSPRFQDKNQKSVIKTSPSINRKPVIIFFISGCAALMCQMIWMRVMVLIIGSSTYAFSLILSIYLIGISIGSLLAAHCLKKKKSSWFSIGILSGIISISILISLPFYNILPYWLIRLYSFVFLHMLPLSMVQGLLCIAVMALPTIGMGALFPYLMGVLVPDNNGGLGSRIGAYAMIAIIGNIAGSLITGLVLIPIIGSEKSLLIAMIIYAIVTIIAWGYSSSSKKIIYAIIFLSVLAGGTLLRPRWNIHLLTSGSFLYAPQYRNAKDFQEFKNVICDNEILYQREGFFSTVTVLHSPWNERFLRINGKTDASWGYDMKTELLLGYMPRLFFPGQPTNALIIGLGAGITAGVMAVDKKIQAIDCVELEPAVKNAAKFFTRVNRFVLEDPRFKLTFTDARHYLTGTRKKYDLIISEPSNPWIAGVATLYTEEAFTLVKNRLTSQGIFCQWLHSYSMGEKDFKMILKTFSSIFPHVMLFTPRENDFLLLGSLNPLVFDYPRVLRLVSEMPEMHGDLMSCDAGHPFTLLATTFVLDDKDIRTYARDALIHRDDRLTLEFSAPLFLYKGEDIPIAINLQKAKTVLLPENIQGLTPSKQEWNLLFNLTGEAFMRVKNAESAQIWFEKAEELRKPDARTLTNLGRIACINNRDFKAEELFKKAIALNPEYALAYFHLGQLYVIQGLEEKGIPYLEKGLEQAPYDPMGTMTLGSLYFKNKRFSDVKRICRKTLASPYLHENIRHQIEQMLAEANKH